MNPTSDHALTIQRAVAVLRTWQGGAEDNLPVALEEAQLIVADDGGADPLVAGLINVAGFLLVNLEQRGQPVETTFVLIEAFVQSHRDGLGEGDDRP